MLMFFKHLERGCPEFEGRSDVGILEIHDIKRQVIRALFNRINKALIRLNDKDHTASLA